MKSNLTPSNTAWRTAPPPHMSQNALLFLETDVLLVTPHHGACAVVAAVNGRHIAPHAVYKRLFEPLAMAALKRVHDAMGERVRYVITSTWRDLLTRNQFDAVFRASGLDFVADHLHEGDAWRTPRKLLRGQRVHEIAQWLAQSHQREPFAVIDGIWSGASLFLGAEASTSPFFHTLIGRVALCKKGFGLSDGDVPSVLRSLHRPYWSAEELGIELAAA